MGLLGDLYTWVDSNLLGGALPGGHEITAPGATIGGVVPTPFYGVQPAPAAPAPVGMPMARPMAAPMPGGGMFGGGAAMQAAAGMPSVAPRMGMPRGRTVTAVATIYPDGSVVPRKMMPGSPVAMSSDLSAVRRAKSAQKRLNKLFPKSAGRSGK